MTQFLSWFKGGGFPPPASCHGKKYPAQGLGYLVAWLKKNQLHLNSKAYAIKCGGGITYIVKRIDFPSSLWSSLIFPSLNNPSPSCHLSEAVTPPLQLSVQIIGLETEGFKYGCFDHLIKTSVFGCFDHIIKRSISINIRFLFNFL